MSLLDKITKPFKSYKGLISLVFLYETVLVLFLSTFSQPMISRFGEMLPWLFPLMELDPARHATRAIMLYHSVALPFIAVLVFIVLDWYAARPFYEAQTKWGMFIGSLLATTAGIDFAYFSKSWISHGIFIFGQSIMAYSAVILIIAIWPTKDFPTVENDPVADVCVMPVKGGSWSWEYLNMALTALAILTSGIIGGIAGASFGQPDAMFPDADPNDPNATWLPKLMETIPRREDHNIGYSYHEMIVAHLHIMLALTAGVVLLLTLKKSNMYGSKFTFMGKEWSWFKISHWLYTPGVIILSIGAWLVITPLPWAHTVINVGAGFLLFVGGIVATYGWVQIARKKLGDRMAEATVMEKVVASFSDPVMWALYFQLWWVNVVSTYPGVYLAFNLEDGRDFRGAEMIDVEYSFNVGHWHVLGVLIALMVAMIIVDEFKMDGVWRKIIGWSAIVGSIVGFGYTTLYMLREPDAQVAFVQDQFDNVARLNTIVYSEHVEFLFLMMDIGIALLFVAFGFAALKILFNLFKDQE